MYKVGSIIEIKIGQEIFYENRDRSSEPEEFEKCRELDSITCDSYILNKKLKAKVLSSEVIDELGKIKYTARPYGIPDCSDIFTFYQ